TVLAFGPQQDVVRNRAAERADALTAKVPQGQQPGRIGITNAQHFAEFVVRDRRRERGTAGRRVLDPAQPHVRVVAIDRLIDRAEVDVDEPRRAPEAGGDQLRDLYVEPDERIRVGGIRFHKWRS